MDFCEKLDFLMNITKTTNSTLAHYTSVDASYISRLRRGKRRLSKNENYVRAMVTYFTKHCVEDYQKKALFDLLSDDGIILDENDKIEEILYNWIIIRTNPHKGVEGFLNDLSLFQFRSSPNIEIQKNINKKDFINSEIGIHYGLKGKRDAVLAFLRSVIDTGSPQTLYLFSDEDMEWLTDDPVFTAKWASLMSQVIRQENKIKVIHTVSRDLDEMLNAIRDWMPLYMTGAIEPYYYPKKRDGIFKRTLFIAPKTVALVSNSVGNMEESIPSMLVFDENAILAFHKEFSNYLSLCKPLMKIFTPKNKSEYYGILSKFERNETFTIMKIEGISILTMPEDLGMRIMLRLGNSSTDELMNYHKSRIENFKKNLLTNSFIDIVRMPDIDQIKAGKVKVAFSDMFYLEDIYYTRDEFKCHLENLVFLLENFKNYHISFEYGEKYQGYMLYAKEDVGVIVAKTSSPSAIIGIDESNITAAFWDYLSQEIDISDIKRKNKDITISKIKRLILEISNI